MPCAGTCAANDRVIPVDDTSGLVAATPTPRELAGSHLDDGVADGVAVDATPNPDGVDACGLAPATRTAERYENDRGNDCGLIPGVAPVGILMFRYFVESFETRGGEEGEYTHVEGVRVRVRANMSAWDTSDDHNLNNMTIALASESVATTTGTYS